MTPIIIGLVGIMLTVILELLAQGAERLLSEKDSTVAKFDAVLIALVFEFVIMSAMLMMAVIALFTK